jgi:hypothetical protein
MAEVHHFTAPDLIVQPSDPARREKAKEANKGGKDEARNSGEDNSERKPGDAHAHG